MSTEELEPGTVLHNRYEISRILTHGGMSILYLATDSHLPGMWVVKQMMDIQGNPEDIMDIRDQFRREAEILSGLSHPGLPRVIDYFHEGDHDYLIEQYIDGKNLDELLAERERLSQHEVIFISLQILEVLEYLHARGIIYRDLKPGNLMIDRGGKVRLVDFGIARLFTAGKKSDTVVVGTPGFASPEHYGKGQTDGRSDIYSLGATMHNLITGLDPAQTPFSFQPPISVIPAISRGLSDIIMTALELNPDHRFASTATMKNALRTCIRKIPDDLDFKYSPLVAVRGPIVGGGTWGIITGAILSSLLLDSGSTFMLIPAWVASLGIASVVKGLRFRGVRIQITEGGILFVHRESTVKAQWEEINSLRVCRTSGMDRTLWGDVTVHPSRIEVTTEKGSFFFTPDLSHWSELVNWIIYRAGLELVKKVEEKGADQVYER